MVWWLTQTWHNVWLPRCQQHSGVPSISFYWCASYVNYLGNQTWLQYLMPWQHIDWITVRHSTWWILRDFSCIKKGLVSCSLKLGGMTVLYPCCTICTGCWFLSIIQHARNLSLLLLEIQGTWKIISSHVNLPNPLRSSCPGTWLTGANGEAFPVVTDRIHRENPQKSFISLWRHPHPFGMPCQRKSIWAHPGWSSLKSGNVLICQAFSAPIICFNWLLFLALFTDLVCFTFELPNKGERWKRGCLKKML